MSEKRATFWSKPTSFEEVQRRAGGRRTHNSIRRLRALLRRREVLDIILRDSLWLTERGTASRIAREVGVHGSTTLRDIRMLLQVESNRGCENGWQFYL